MEKEEGALQIQGLEMSQGVEVRNEEGNRTGFIARKDETGRARVGQPWKSWRLSWELVVDRMWQGESQGPHWVSGLEPDSWWSQ